MKASGFFFGDSGGLGRLVRATAAESFELSWFL